MKIIYIYYKINIYRKRTAKNTIWQSRKNHSVYVYKMEQYEHTLLN